MPRVLDASIIRQAVTIRHRLHCVKSPACTQGAIYPDNEYDVVSNRSAPPIV